MESPNGRRVPTEREQQFLTLIRSNEARLRRICRVYAFDAEARKDLQQEILLQIWRSLPSFTGASTPETWLYRVALNTALGFSRRQSVRREASLPPEAYENAEIATESLDTSMESEEQTARLHAAIERLGSVDRMLVTMYLDDRSYREMADVLGISENLVGVKLHRIRKALATFLTETT
jgi:RNA polymerase sigma-70 factor, ECF subfamily